MARTLPAEDPPAKHSRDPSPLSPASALLGWYDRHRRDLPWRARPGETADPYRVWLSEIMLQQTTVKAVGPYFARFLERFPTVEALAAAPSEAVMSAWAGLGYYSRARNLHACAKAVVERHGGRFPADEQALRALPGIGPYTAAAVTAIAFDLPAVPVDGNVERVVTRLFTIADPLPGAKPLVGERARSLAPQARHGDFAQALFDLGATICTPKRPACALCPLREACAAVRAGDPTTYPVKAAKREGQPRHGVAFVARRGEDVLLGTRPPKGLLGGMAEVPTTPWTHEMPGDPDEHAPLAAAWRRVPGAVTHVFTHFPLTLAVLVAEVPAGTAAPEGLRWTPRGALGDEPLPGLMRKVLAHAGL